MSQSAAPRARTCVHMLPCFAVMAASQLFVYYITRLVLPHLTLHILTGPLDARIPFSPPWVTVYCLCFPFWLAIGLWVASREKPRAYRACASYVLAMLLSGAVFLLWPGTMARPEPAGTDIFAAWVRLIYALDSPTNLCPSLHVLVTYFCFRCIAADKAPPRWCKGVVLVFFMLVCCSVLFVKQHALIDVPAGIAVGELALQGGRVFRLERIGFAIEKRFRKEGST